MQFDLYLVPAEISFMPAPEAIEAAVSFLEEVFAKWVNGVQPQAGPFPHPVGAAETVGELRCPACGAMHRPDDERGKWWRDLFEQIYDHTRDASRVTARMPCCGKVVAAGDIDFQGVVRFSRFSIEIWDYPADERPLTPDELVTLERYLGCKIIPFEGWST